MPRIRDIPQFPYSRYSITLGWNYLLRYIDQQVSEDGLDLDPDYQRPHVWTEAQQIAYVEYKLRGGVSASDLWANCANWNHGLILGAYELLDGKQRITAVMKFMRNKLPAFGHYYFDYKDKVRLTSPHFNWKVMSLGTRAEVLQWYIDNNSAGTQHTEEELGRVVVLLEKELELNG